MSSIYFIYYLLSDILALHVLGEPSGVASCVTYVEKVVPIFKGLRYMNESFGNFEA